MGRLRVPALNYYRLLLGCGTVLALSALMGFHFLPDRVSVRVGERSSIEIRAARSVTYVDTSATRRQREFAASMVGPVFSRETSASADAVATVDDVFGRTDRARLDRARARESTLITSLDMDLGLVLNRGQLRYLLTAPAPSYDRLRTAARRLIAEAMDREIREHTDDLRHARARYERRSAQTVAGAMDLAILRAIGQHGIRPNLVEDARRTLLAREPAIRAIAPVMGQVRAGETIVQAGDVFTQLHLDQCTALGLIQPRLSAAMWLSIVALSTMMVAIVAIYIRRSRSAIYAQPKLLLLLALIVVLSVFGLRLFGNLLGLPLSGLQFGYLGMMMVVASTMLIAALLDMSVAVLVAALLAVVSGLIMNHELRFSVVTLVSSLVGIYFVRSIRDRAHLMWASAALAGTNVVMAWTLGGILSDSVSEMLSASAWALLASAFAVPIFWSGVAMLEKPFGLLTHVWLLELSSSERPLLRRLCTEAPGTYAHSIMVGNLAESAAEAIGADALFCRVASYYHDVGKLRRPEFFAENQRGENAHDALHPSLSALIVAAHVRDGLDLANEYRLPHQIADVIASHQGSTLIRYFYHRVLFERGTLQVDPVLEQHFRYEGPRPRTRESGIIMLADTVEAAARCMEKPTVVRIRGLVDTLVQDKLADGQLDECALTLRDLQKVRDAFVHVLGAMLHGRVGYPDLPPAARGPSVPRQEPGDARVRSELALAQTEDTCPGRGGGPSVDDGG